MLRRLFDPSRPVEMGSGRSHADETRGTVFFESLVQLPPSPRIPSGCVIGDDVR